MADIYPRRSVLAQLEGITFTTDLPGSLTWTLDDGSPATGSNYFFSWPVPGGPFRIAVSNGSIQIYRDVSVAYSLTLNPSLIIQGKERMPALLHTMKDGSRRSRIEIDRKREWEFKFKGHTPEEYATFLEQWEQYFPAIAFTTLDPMTEQYSQWYFDSEPAIDYGEGGCGVDFSVRVVEA